VRARGDRPDRAEDSVLRPDDRVSAVERGPGRERAQSPGEPVEAGPLPLEEQGWSAVEALGVRGERLTAALEDAAGIAPQRSAQAIEAGAELPLFEPAAEEALFQATSGLPRKINLLAHHTLIAAALTRAKLATADHVQAALPEVA